MSSKATATLALTKNKNKKRSSERIGSRVTPFIDSGVIGEEANKKAQWEPLVDVR